MYAVLIAAMAERKVTQRNIAAQLGVHYNTVCAKLSGRRDFTIEEARRIHSEWFSDIDFVTLFTAKPSNQPA